MKYISYRNSKLTSLLRDSLGGNCITTMLATFSLEEEFLHESIATLKFGKMVSKVSNDAIINEEMDPKIVIQQLKKQLEQLKGLQQNEARELTEEEKDR